MAEGNGMIPMDGKAYARAQRYMLMGHVHGWAMELNIQYANVAWLDMRRGQEFLHLTICHPYGGVRSRHYKTATRDTSSLTLADIDRIITDRPTDWPAHWAWPSVGQN